MYDDAVTEALRNVCYAIACGLAAGLVTYLGVWAFQVRWHRRRNRPYDWARDGECDNRSKVRVLDD